MELLQNSIEKGCNYLGGSFVTEVAYGCCSVAQNSWIGSIIHSSDERIGSWLIKFYPSARAKVSTDLTNPVNCSPVDMRMGIAKHYQSWRDHILQLRLYVLLRSLRIFSLIRPHRFCEERQSKTDVARTLVLTLVAAESVEKVNKASR